MSPTNGRADDDRYSYAEHTGESGEETNSGTIFDADNEDAWIESDTLVDIAGEADADPRAETRYDAETGTYHLEYEWRDAMPLSMIVVMIVSDLEGVAPTEIDPLYDYLDPELLDKLFSPRPDGTLDAGEVSFTYIDYEITVFRHGHISVRPPAE
jgi:hypothetical protein